MTGPIILRVAHIHRRRFKGFLDVPYNGTETIAQMKARIAAQCGLRVSYISYRGLFLSKTMRIAELCPDLKPMEPPRFAVHTKTLSGKEIFVRTLTGKLLLIFLPLSSTVRELKEEIRDLEDTPLDKQRLLFAGKLLDDDHKKLMDYKMSPNSIVDEVELPTKLASPQLFVPDLEESRSTHSALDILQPNDPEKLEFLEWGSPWRVAAAGLNVEGECHNMECVAYGKMVICAKGFTAFNLTSMAGQCPMCSHEFEPAHCAFTACAWMYEGRATEASAAPPRIRDSVSRWFTAGVDQYELFQLPEEEEGLVQWESLIITARQPTTTFSPHKLLNRIAECAICYEEVHVNNVMAKAAQSHVAADCGHAFHVDCVTLWKASGGISCPTCRGSITV